MLENDQAPKGEKNLWEGVISLLDNLEFNHSSRFTDYCNVEPDYMLQKASNIKITIPSFNPKTQIKWPNKVYRAKLCYIITTYAKETYKPLKDEVFKIEFGFSSPPLAAKSFVSKTLPSPCFVIISCCILYFKNDSLLGSILLNHTKLHPAKIAKTLRITD
jgi:hypothetical protein